MTREKPRCFLCRACGHLRRRSVARNRVRLCGDCLTHRPWRDHVLERLGLPVPKREEFW